MLIMALYFLVIGSSVNEVVTATCGWSRRSRGRQPRNFAASLAALLSGDYSGSKVDMVEQLNQKLKG